MSAIVVKVRKARKDYFCPGEWAHDPKIREGETYARVKVATDDGWADELTFHVDCAEDLI